MRGVAASVLSRPSSGTEYHDMTPRQQQQDEASVDSGSPDRYLLRQEIAEVWGENAPEGTENTADEQERLKDLADICAQVDGSDHDGLAFLLDTESLCREYRQEYADSLFRNPEQIQAGQTLKTYALERLHEMRASGFPTLYELKRHVFALGKLAGRTPQGSRDYVRARWESSTDASPEGGAFRPPSPQEEAGCHGGRASPTPNDGELPTGAEGVRGFVLAPATPLKRAPEGEPIRRNTRRTSRPTPLANRQEPGR